MDRALIKLEKAAKGSLRKPSLLVFRCSLRQGCTNSVAHACEKQASDRKIGDWDQDKGG
jgi:hypothetical protein